MRAVAMDRPAEGEGCFAPSPREAVAKESSFPRRRTAVRNKWWGAAGKRCADWRYRACYVAPTQLCHSARSRGIHAAHHHPPPHGFCDCASLRAEWQLIPDSSAPPREWRR